MYIAIVVIVLLVCLLLSGLFLGIKNRESYNVIMNLGSTQRLFNVGRPRHARHRYIGYKRRIDEQRNDKHEDNEPVA